MTRNPSSPRAMDDQLGDPRLVVRDEDQWLRGHASTPFRPRQGRARCILCHRRYRVTRRRRPGCCRCLAIQDTLPRTDRAMRWDRDVRRHPWVMFGSHGALRLRRWDDACVSTRAWVLAIGRVPRRPGLPRTDSRWSLIVAVAGALGFAGVLAVVRRKRTEALDLAVTMRLQAVRHAFLARIMTAVSWPGFPPQSRIIPPLLIALEMAVAVPAGGPIQGLAWGTSRPLDHHQVVHGSARPGGRHRPARGRRGPRRHQLSERPRAQLRGHVRLAGCGRRRQAPAASGRAASSSAVLASARGAGGTQPDLPGSPLGDRRHGLVSAGLQLSRRAW